MKRFFTRSVQPSTKEFPQECTYLDHGGFVVTPREILEVQYEHRQQIEKAPRIFFAQEYPLLWKRVSKAVAERFNVRENDMAFVQNVTDGVNAVLRSLDLHEGDEILTTSLTYGAIDKAAHRIATLNGAVRIVVPMPFFSDLYHRPADYIELLRKAIGPRTKLVILDHISSASALLFPIKEMVSVCREYSLPVLVDAAHVPGQVSFDINSINADWYVASLHKWYFIPRSCGFLWAAPEHQKRLVPNILSWDCDLSFPTSFRWTGTQDVSPLISIPDAFAFMDRFGEQNVMRHNHELVMEGMKILCEAWNTRAYAPESMIGSMVTLPMPKGLPFDLSVSGCEDIQTMLWKEKQIAVSIPFAQNGRHHVRIAAQIYNGPEDYEKLAKAVLALGRG